MIVTVTFDVDTEAFAEEHDTEGMNASDVRRSVRKVIDEVVREDPRTTDFILPGLAQRPARKR